MDLASAYLGWPFDSCHYLLALLEQLGLAVVALALESASDRHAAAVLKVHAASTAGPWRAVDSFLRDYSWEPFLVHIAADRIVGQIVRVVNSRLEDHVEYLPGWHDQNALETFETQDGVGRRDLVTLLQHVVDLHVVERRDSEG